MSTNSNSRLVLIIPILIILVIAFVLTSIITTVNSLDLSFLNRPTSTPTPTPIVFPTLTDPIEDIVPDEVSLDSLDSPLVATPTRLPPTQKPVANCYRLNIREGEFISNKCYSLANYNLLHDYLWDYDSANFDLHSAQGSIDITCNCRNSRECEFFKDTCSQAKQKKSQAEADLTKYRSLIQSIISQGK